MATLFPCGGVDSNSASLKTVNGVVTSVDSVATTFTTVLANCGAVKFDSVYFKNTNGILTAKDNAINPIPYIVSAPCGGFKMDNLHFWLDTDNAVCFDSDPQYFVLVVTSALGTDYGFTKITVNTPIHSGLTYVYKTASSVTTPDFQEDLSSWTAWDGIEEIEALADDEIYIAEVDGDNKCWFTGYRLVNSLKEITATSVAGTLSGDTLITVEPTLTAGNSYVYRTAETVALPAYDDDLSLIAEWLTWDGTSDITAVTGDEIVIAEINSEGYCRAFDKTIVVSKA